MKSIEYHVTRVTKERIRDLHDKGRRVDEIATQMMFGLVEEVGEFIGLQKGSLKGKRIDRDIEKEELGDIFWYLFNVVDILGYNVGDILECNETKLKERYPQ
jgi:NTP pyrophosphatase (non-canonical NTP hydrolase)